MVWEGQGVRTEKSILRVTGIGKDKLKLTSVKSVQITEIGSENAETEGLLKD